MWVAPMESAPVESRHFRGSSVVRLPLVSLLSLILLLLWSGVAPRALHAADSQSSGPKESTAALSQIRAIAESALGSGFSAVRGGVDFAWKRVRGYPILLNVDGFGRAELQFSKVRRLTDGRGGKYALLQGVARVRSRGPARAEVGPRQVVVASAAVSLGKGSLQQGASIPDRSGTATRGRILFSVAGHHGIPAFAAVRDSVGEGGGSAAERVSAVTGLALSGKSCSREPLEVAFATGGVSPGISQPFTLAAVASGVSKRLTVGIDADQSMVSRYGPNLFLELAASHNQVDAVYQSQLGIQLSLVYQHSELADLPWPRSIRDSEALLDSFRRYGEQTRFLGTVDLKHLFTRRELLDSVLGISYQDAACQFPGYSYGLTQYVNRELGWVITAHEFGHNLGATHTTGIMGASLGSPPPTSFASVSQREIRSYLGDVGGQCSGGLGPRREARLSVTTSKQKGKFLVKILPKETLSQCSVGYYTRAKGSSKRIISSKNIAGFSPQNGKTITLRISSATNRPAVLGVTVGCRARVPSLFEFSLP